MESSKNSLATLVSSGSCEQSSEVAVTMSDAMVASVSCHPYESSNDLNSVEPDSGNNGSAIDSEVPGQEGLQLQLSINDKCEHEESPTQVKEEKFNNGVECIATPNKLNNETGTKEDTQAFDEEANGEPNKKHGLISSTPDMDKKFQDYSKSHSSDVSDFGLVSPLDVKCLKIKQNLKRKYVGLQTIDEIDEDTDITNKKIKVDEEKEIGNNSVAPSEASTSSVPCFEAPAKSLLKKWQLSCLSRNTSAASFIVLDECGETEFEDSPKLSQENELPRDDFEVAYQSLTEELLKSSSNIETLEKYHSQVQLENQMDDEKFDEILKELTVMVDLDDKTCLSLRSMDESTIIDSDKTIEAIEESVDTFLAGSENKDKFDTTAIEKNNQIPIGDDVSVSDHKTDSIKKECKSEILIDTDDNATSEQKPIKNELSPNDEEALDEEEFLLEEKVNSKDKPYEFFEFVSSDPKENEDNYNPEWQKLGQLTSDEERYKAVRDRWRSLVPPDPNRNLTYRQWRAKNNKSPIKLSPLNNNHQLMDDNEKNQLCTAVFDNKITRIVQELEDSRMNIYRQRNREFEQLGHAQDREQMRAQRSGFSYPQMAQLHATHLNQCRAVKNQYDQELKRITLITEEKCQILRDAREEVLLFQKFYKGVGARDDNDLYMTDIQVQELMETEEMLEQYKVFYGD